MPRSRKKTTGAERLGYRWMMRFLRALDKGRNHVLVHHADSRDYPGGFKGFKADCRLAIAHAVSLMRHGSMSLYYEIEKPPSLAERIDEARGTEPESDEEIRKNLPLLPYPKSFRVIFYWM